MFVLATCCVRACVYTSLHVFTCLWVACLLGFVHSTAQCNSIRLVRRALRVPPIPHMRLYDIFHLSVGCAFGDIIISTHALDRRAFCTYLVYGTAHEQVGVLERCWVGLVHGVRFVWNKEIGVARLIFPGDGCLANSIESLLLLLLLLLLL